MVHNVYFTLVFKIVLKGMDIYIYILILHIK